MTNTVTFSIPYCPPSVNSLYTINYRAPDPRDRVTLKPQCRDWKTYCKAYIPAFTVAETSIVRVDRLYYYSWFTQRKTWTRRDVSNMDKLLFDMIKEKIGVDDCRFKLGMMDSRNGNVEKTVVVLTEVTAEEWGAW